MISELSCCYRYWTYGLSSPTASARRSYSPNPKLLFHVPPAHVNVKVHLFGGPLKGKWSMSDQECWRWQGLRRRNIADRASLLLVRSKPFFSEPQGDEKVDDQSASSLPFFVSWDIPWDGKTVIVTMTAFGVSFLFTGLGISLFVRSLGLRQQELLNLDDQSFVIFIDQLTQTIIGIGAVNFCIRNYKPLPVKLFKYDFKNPFGLQRGWFLWGLVGIVSGASAVLLAGTISTFVNGEPLPREGQDALLQLLPLIGASKTSTALLLAVTGILAPFLEETVFRGFLMTSLTKWMPLPLAVVLSAGAFALAHFTPSEIPQLFALGVVLGFAYAKSGNLLTPIMVHGLWNSGVVILLTLLRLQGYNIQEII